MIASAVRQLDDLGRLAVLLYGIAMHRGMLIPAEDAPAVGRGRDAEARPSTSPAMRSSIMPTKAAISGSMRPSTGAAVRFCRRHRREHGDADPADAAAAGISHSSLSYSIVTSTANGRGAPRRCGCARCGSPARDQRRPGGRHRQSAHVAARMSFLKRLEHVEMGEGTLTIYWD